jgi:hypothetical protein
MCRILSLAYSHLYYVAMHVYIIFHKYSKNVKIQPYWRLPTVVFSTSLFCIFSENFISSKKNQMHCTGDWGFENVSLNCHITPETKLTSTQAERISSLYSSCKVTYWGDVEQRL